MIEAMTFASLADRKLGRRFLLAAIVGVLFFSWNYGASIARASYYISTSTLPFLYHFNLPASSTNSASSSWDLTTVGWSTSSSIRANLHEGVYSSSFGNTYTDSMTPVNILPGDVSVGGWYNVTSTGDQRIVSFADVDNAILYHNYDGTNDTPKCQFIDSGQAHVWTITGSSTSGSRHFVVCTWNHSTGDGQMYIDGVLNQTVTHASAGALKAGTSRLYIGKGVGADGPTNGSIDEVFLTNNVLTSSTISSLYGGGGGQEICTTPGCGIAVVTVSIATSSLQQYKADATTTIPESASTTESTVTFGANLQTTGTSTVQLQVELVPFNDAFTGTANILSSSVSSGTVTVSSSQLADGLYYWKAQAADGNNVNSGWKTLSTPAANYDFAVRTYTTPLVELPSSSVKFLYHFHSLASSTDSSNNDYDLTSQGWSATSSTLLPNLHNGIYSTSFAGTYTNSLTPATVFASSDISVAAWYNASSTGGDQRIASFGDVDNAILYHNFDGTNDTPKCQFIDTGQAHVWSITGSSTAGSKHFVICTWNHSTGDAQMYIDGVLNQIVNHASAGTIKAGNSRLYIGYGPSDGNSNGTIDEVLITSSVLPASTISSLWNNGLGAEACNWPGCSGGLPIIGSNLNQYQANASDTIAAGGGTTPDTSAVFKGTVTFATATGTLEIEVKQAGTSFTGTPNATSAPVSSGNIASATFSGLLNRSFHWQARGKDSSGNTSAWQLFGSSTNTIDFRVASLANAASMYFSTSSLTYSAASDTFSATDPFTIEFWYRSHVTSTIQTLIDSRGATSTKGFEVFRDTDNPSSTSGIGFVMNCATGSLAFHTASSTFRNNGDPRYDKIGIWHHVAIAKSASTTLADGAFYVYFDGVFQPTFVTSEGPGPISGNCFDASSTNSITFGKDRTATSSYNYLTGNLDEVRIWNVQRPSSSITTYWNQEVTSTDSTLNGLWRFNANSTDLRTGNASSGQDGSPSFASSTPFGHFIETYSSVSGTQMIWAGSTKYAQFNSAVDTWNFEPAIDISFNAVTSSANLVIVDASDTSVAATAEYCNVSQPIFPCDFPTSTQKDTLFFDVPIIDGLSTSSALTSVQIQAAATHELGHALGLDHSYYGNVMYPIGGLQRGCPSFS
jgi:adhesin HecA-like repeat protein